MAKLFEVRRAPVIFYIDEKSQVYEYEGPYRVKEFLEFRNNTNRTIVFNSIPGTSKDVFKDVVLIALIFGGILLFLVFKNFFVKQNDQNKSAPASEQSDEKNPQSENLKINESRDKSKEEIESSSQKKNK